MAQDSEKLAPGRALSPYVAFMRIAEAASEAVTAPYLRLPDGRLELVVRFDAHETSVHVVGTRTVALRKRTTPAERFLTLRFKVAGAYPFLGLPVCELTDQMVPLEQLWRTAVDGLVHELTQARSDEERVAALQRALAARAREACFEPASAGTVRRAVRLVHAASELPTVSALANILGASTRQLRRSFDDTLGVRPKQYLRIVRFQRALSAARRAPELNWSAVARLAGYCDQAHLSEEFQALAGSRPTTLR
ncbi:MAG: Transcriptional regulator, AraC family protein [Myxococcaceae bacterium]|nr:Transcriptional regulator, AraC family protein [Myxococcaceae bacterium]